MTDQVEIVNNCGEKKMVSKGFAEAFKKAHSRSLGDPNKCEEIPIWDFPEDMQKELKGIGSKTEDKPIKKGYEQYL